MARAHFWQYLINEEGQPVNAANISVYEAGTTTPAYVYSGETGGTASNTPPQTTTNSNGYFEFWVADDTETNGYAAGTKFLIAWSKPGVIDDGEVDYVDIIVQTTEVDETDNTSTAKNKSISNYLAYTWSHKANVTTSAVAADDWTESDGNYYIDITHNFNNAYPMVVCYEDATTQTASVIAESESVNKVRIWKADKPACRITVIG